SKRNAFLLLGKLKVNTLDFERNWSFLQINLEFQGRTKFVHFNQLKCHQLTPPS
ncbi:MAG: hypothetical protein RL390_1014, partial [Actinomycetota bacterium]